MELTIEDVRQLTFELYMAQRDVARLLEENGRLTAMIRQSGAPEDNERIMAMLHQSAPPQEHDHYHGHAHHD